MNKKETNYDQGLIYFGRRDEATSTYCFCFRLFPSLVQHLSTENNIWPARLCRFLFYMGLIIIIALSMHENNFFVNLQKLWI